MESSPFVAGMRGNGISQPGRSIGEGRKGYDEGLVKRREVRLTWTGDDLSRGTKVEVTIRIVRLLKLSVYLSCKTGRKTSEIVVDIKRWWSGFR